MRLIISTFCVLVTSMWVLAGDEEAIIKERASRYTEAVRKQDKTGIEKLLRDDYQGHRLPVFFNSAKPFRDRSDAVAMWMDPATVFTNVEYGIDSVVRIIGETAIENGSSTINYHAKGNSHQFSMSGRYVRVWIKDKDGWRVAHESY